jgi:hypothetical protein
MTKFFSELESARMTVETEGVSCSTVRRAYAGKPVSPALYNLITGAARKLGLPAPPPLVPRKRREPRTPKLANPLYQPCSLTGRILGPGGRALSNPQKKDGPVCRGADDHPCLH